MRRQLLILTLIIGLLGCTSSGENTDWIAPATASIDQQTQGTAASSATNTLPAVTLQLEQSAEPQEVHFRAGDDTPLAGTFWPPASENAPGLLLMHWNPGSRDDWSTLAGLLQGQGIAAPSGADSRSYAVFAFDFRGHGDSAGQQDRAGYLEDAKAALALFRAMPGVDPNRIVLIGASIGADAAVDACGEGCIGAISLSPGDYLGMPYRDALAALGEKPVLCVATESDTTSANACRGGKETGLGDYQMQIYQGNEHGMDLFAIVDQPPALTDLIFEWLRTHTP